MQSINNYYITNDQNIEDIPQDVQVLKFIKYRNNTVTSINFSKQYFGQLKSIIIYNYCCKQVCAFVIDGLEYLENVRIGMDCFKKNDEEYIDGICRIANCPNLHQLEIGDDSFRYFKSFELSNVNSIQSIEFGDNCLRNADFSLKGV